MTAVDSDADLVKVLSHSRTVALYGISGRADSVSLKTAEFLKDRHHDLYFINPLCAGQVVSGRKILASFWGIPRGVKVDLALFFPAESSPDEAVVDASITRYTRYLWVDPGTLDLELIGYATQWYEAVVLNRSLMQEYDRLLKGEAPKEISAPAFPPWWEAPHRLRRIPEGLE